MSKAEATNEEVKEPLVNVDRDKYQPTKSASGTKSLNNGDEIAVLVDGFSLEAMYFTAKKFIGEDFSEKYAKLNVGMQRMNLGNRIRGHVRKVDTTNEKAVAKAKADGAQVPDVVSGMDQLHKIADPIREKVDKAREKEAADKAKKAEAAAKAKSDKETAKTEKKPSKSKAAA